MTPNPANEALARECANRQAFEQWWLKEGRRVRQLNEKSMTRMAWEVWSAAILSYAEKAEGWVSMASGNLPTKARDVLLRYEVACGLVDSCMAVGWLDGDGNWYEKIGGNSSQHTEWPVTHWRPLPAPPKENE